MTREHEITVPKTFLKLKMLTNQIKSIWDAEPIVEAMEKASYNISFSVIGGGKKWVLNLHQTKVQFTYLCKVTKPKGLKLTISNENDLKLEGVFVMKVKPISIKLLELKPKGNLLNLKTDKSGDKITYTIIVPDYVRIVFDGDNSDVEDHENLEICYISNEKNGWAIELTKIGGIFADEPKVIAPAGRTLHCDTPLESARNRLTSHKCTVTSISNKPAGDIILKLEESTVSTAKTPSQKSLSISDVRGHPTHYDPWGMASMNNIVN